MRVAEEERLFEVPRVAVELDEADPNVIKLAFSGTVELDRGTADDVELYNALAAGSVQEVTVAIHVAGAQNRHRRDSQGVVDAIVQTKAIVVDEVVR